MKVVDIHPEELIDKLHDGALTAAERERLDAHLAQCSACRFEISVRSDFAEDAPMVEERPQLTFPGSSPRERAMPQEVPAPRVSPSLRARSRRRWPLAMLAAALVLSAGGAMAAVITGAVAGPWLGWSSAPKPAESSAHVSEAKPTVKPKRVGSAPLAAAAPQIEASAEPVASAPSEMAQTPVAAINSPARSVAHSKRSEVAPPEPVSARAASVSSIPTAPGAGAGEVPTARFDGSSRVDASSPRVDASSPRVDAASLFADANRARRDGNADRAVALYRTLQSRFPSSSESELSRALLAQLLLDRGNPEAALAGFDRYLAEDTPVLSAEALVGRARALEQLGKSAQAAAAWRQVQTRFPGSVHARLAATRLAALGTR
ncbi:MAG TPA: tetratricopeptide repeat protein [Polyangiaceae bacterium]|nr:tetratricopeptide repeat protein [Polyangiaceae bacterium]